MDYRVKSKASEKRGNYLDPARELRKLWYMMRVTVKLVVIGAIGKARKGVWKCWKLEDESRTSKLQIGQNTEKSSGDVRRLVIGQIPANAGVKNSLRRKKKKK